MVGEWGVGIWDLWMGLLSIWGWGNDRLGTTIGWKGCLERFGLWGSLGSGDMGCKVYIRIGGFNIEFLGWG